MHSCRSRQSLTFLRSACSRHDLPFVPTSQVKQLSIFRETGASHELSSMIGLAVTTCYSDPQPQQARSWGSRGNLATRTFRTVVSHWSAMKSLTKWKDGRLLGRTNRLADSCKTGLVGLEVRNCWVILFA